MKQRKAMLLQLAILGILGAGVLISLALPSSGLLEPSQQVIEISVIARDEDDVYWENTKIGMEQAAREAGAELRFLYLSRPNAQEEQMELIVDMIDRVLSDIENEANIAAVRKEVNELMAQYPLFAW